MSISSTTITFALERDRVEAACEIVRGDDPWSLAEEVKAEEMFGSGARRAYTEHELHQLIQRFRPIGLEYLDAVQANGYYRRALRAGLREENAWRRAFV